MTGHNSIKMTELAELYVKIGFSDAETYIQSGNVIFTDNSETDPSSHSIKIENAILERFKYIVPAMVRTVQDLSEIFSVNPFLGERNFDPSKMAVIFLHEEVTEAQIL